MPPEFMLFMLLRLFPETGTPGAPGGWESGHSRLEGEGGAPETPPA